MGQNRSAFAVFVDLIVFRPTRPRSRSHPLTRLHMQFELAIFTFRATTSDVDYLENQCAKEPEQRSQSCDYLEYENQDLGYADLQLSTPTKDEV